MPQFVFAQVDVAIFAMAQRYAISRYLTGAAESAADSIIVNASEIKRDQGICSAIIQEAKDYLSRSDADVHGSRDEYDENRRRWQKVIEALS